MGMSFCVYTHANHCPVCGRSDRKELFYGGNEMLKEGMSTRTEPGIISYGSTSSAKLFNEHFEPYRDYQGAEALAVLEKVKDAIVEEAYKKIFRLMQEPDAIMWAGW